MTAKKRIVPEPLSKTEFLEYMMEFEKRSTTSRQDLKDALTTVAHCFDVERAKLEKHDEFQDGRLERVDKRLLTVENASRQTTWLAGVVGIVSGVVSGILGKQ